MSNEIQSQKPKKYDLEERTARFGEEIIDFAKDLPKNIINLPLIADDISNLRFAINQLIRSATSIGANYMEADGAESKKDFEHKIAICKKESKETKHWLRMIVKANPDKPEECRKFWQEAQEFTLIFSSIIKKKKEF